MTESPKRHTPEGITLPSGKKPTSRSGPLVMGIINCTPDSFYPGSRRFTKDEALSEAGRMMEEGAHILDVGGESSRPGSEYVGVEEELRRVIPVIEGIRSMSDVAISVDTRKARVAEAALNAGADIINDIAALQDDPDIAPLVARRGAQVVLMHKQGSPKTMQNNPDYGDAVTEIAAELSAYAQQARAAGISKEKIILDPGIGFGKRLEDNLAVLRHLDVFTTLGYPLLLGASRKSFLGMILGTEVDDRLIGTLAVHAWAYLKGVDIVRVHDVEETVQVFRILSAIRGE